MAPSPFRRVVVARQHRVALGTGEPRALAMTHPNVDALAFDGQFDPGHLPRRGDTEQVTVEVGVFHRHIVAAPVSSPPANGRSLQSPTKNPEAPQFLSSKGRPQMSISISVCFG